MASGMCKPADVPLDSAIVLSASDGAPIFRVTCHNESREPRDRVNVIDAVRLDDRVFDPGFIGSMLDGPPPPAPAGQTWDERVALLPTEPRWNGTGTFGLRTFRVPLTPGRHTVAFRCAGQWSRVIQFDWDK